ncbi:MAG: LPS-assembly protein LptD [Hyphomicrobiales bacterium]
MSQFSSSIKRLSPFNRATKNCVRGFAMGAALLVSASVLPINGAYAQGTLSNIGGNIQSEDERLLLDAETLTFDSDNDVVTVSGDVQIFLAGNSLEADKVVYDRKAGILKAIGKVRLIEVGGNVVRSEEIELSDDFKNGFIKSLQIESIDETYFAAASGERINGEKIILKRGVYSVCAVCRVKPGRIPTWRIKAEEIIIDDVSHRIRYKNASFELLGVPIAYLPAFSHVDPRVKQKTGILRPNFVQDTDLGIGIGIPYYYAVNESTDLTVTPTYFTDQGLLGEIEWRQRTAKGAYTLKLAGIHQQEPEEFTGESGDREFRGGLRTTGKFNISSQWNAGWDILALTDRTFAEDYSRLTTRVDRFTSNANLTGLSATNFFDARAMFFNVLDDDDATSGNLQAQQAIVHPSIDYDGIIDKAIAGGQLSFTANVTSISRFDEDVNVINGQSFQDGASGTQGRVSTEIEWKRRFIAKGGHVVTPLLALRGDAQAFDQANSSITGIPDKDQIARGQVTAGLEWRYPVLITHGNTSHIFEPIGQIFASPNEQQIDRFLNEDSQTLVLDDTNIFSRDRFAGFDRVEGGVRANVGFTHKTQWNDWFKTDALVGQSFHLAGENSFANQGTASLEVENGLQDDSSDVVARIAATIVDQYSLIGRIRVDSNYSDVSRGDVVAAYTSDILSLSAGYTFINGQTVDDLPRSAQANGSFSFKPHEYWTLFGDARYDFDDNQFVNNRIGVAFDDKQLRVSLAFVQDFDEDGPRDGEGFEFSVNFRTLGGF